MAEAGAGRQGGTLVPMATVDPVDPFGSEALWHAGMPPPELTLSCVALQLSHRAPLGRGTHHVGGVALGAAEPAARGAEAAAGGAGRGWGLDVTKAVLA